MGNRVNDYFQDSYYKSKSTTLIHSAILKYGICNFALAILEFVDKDNLLSRENYFIEIFPPQTVIGCISYATNSVRGESLLN